MECCLEEDLNNFSIIIVRDNLTIIVVSHRMNTIANADSIFKVENFELKKIN